MQLSEDNGCSKKTQEQVCGLVGWDIPVEFGKLYGPCLPYKFYYFYGKIL